MNLIKRAFTLVELVVVIIVLGLLATLAIPRFQKQLERGRAAEAYRILAEIRTAEEIYKNETGSYGSLQDIGMQDIENCNETHFFQYSITRIGQGYGIATRCTEQAGRQPGSSVQYSITINLPTGEINDNGLNNLRF